MLATVDRLRTLEGKAPLKVRSGDRVRRPAATIHLCVAATTQAINTRMIGTMIGGTSHDVI
jgi:hypothetical protein